MIVMKFGGTSVGSVQGLQHVKEIVTRAEQPVVVVVSALAGITDLLTLAAQQAATQTKDYQQTYDQIVIQHQRIIDALIPPQEGKTNLLRTINGLLEALRNLLQGVHLLGELSQRSMDAILSYGERLSTHIVTAYIPGAEWADATKIIKTQTLGNQHFIAEEPTKEAIQSTLRRPSPITIIGGFIATDALCGVVTNLGRGGSDYTASLIAAALQANRLEIWTDVDGFMTADPKLIPTAKTIESLSYREAVELCNFGAKVLYPPTIFPACRQDIPIYIRNTYQPKHPGSIIQTSVPHTAHPVRGISSIDNISMLTVTGLSIVGRVNINSRIFNTLAIHHINVLLVIQTATETSTSLCIKSGEAQRACNILNEIFASEIETGAMLPINCIDHLATIAVVGERMKRTTGMVGRLFGVLGNNGVSLTAVAQGASETNISLVIAQDQLRKALNVIHNSFFLSDCQVLNIFVVGENALGREFLTQLAEQQASIKEQEGVYINVVGIIGKDQVAVDTQGINLHEYENALQPYTIHGVGQVLHKIVECNAFNAVMVDCSAKKSVSHIYANLFESNVSIVSANKYAASSAYENYQQLKKAAYRRGVKFCFETNVGASLPILRNINLIKHGGDKIVAMQTLVCSAYNFALNNLSATMPFSKAFKKAAELGLCEEDPRLDASGMDLLRKLVIMVRESGTPIEKREVDWQRPIDEEICKLPLETFWEALTQVDEFFETKRTEAEREHRKLCLMASWEDGKASIALRMLGQDHPLYHTQGSHNAVLLYTQRYTHTPILLQGYGAGIRVMAAGLLADLVDIGRSL